MLVLAAQFFSERKKTSEFSVFQAFVSYQYFFNFLEPLLTIFFKK